MPIKFLLLGGGGVLEFFRRGGGGANFIFMGVGIFPILRKMTRVAKKGGGKRIVGGGVQKRFWGGALRRIYGMFSTPLSFPPPLAAL